MAGAALTVAAPAKLNISLRVLGRRSDGMHEVDSVMTLVDFADTVRISRREDGQLRRRWSHPQVKEDLCMRAASLLQRRTGARAGADILVRKRIPVGGGLGGGSSDAAAVLLALDSLWKTRLSRRDMLALAAELGADVPFFIYGRAARARGAGESLSPCRSAFLRDFPHYLLAFPEAESITADAYARYKSLNLRGKNRTITPALVDNANDLAEAVFDLHPQVARTAQALRDAAGEARLSGSGACVYAAFASASAARRARAALPAGTRAALATRLARRIPWGVAKW